MSRARTAIRRMYGMGPNSLYRAAEKSRAQIEALDGCPIHAYLVVPDNPVARAAMVERTVDTLWPEPARPLSVSASRHWRAARCKLVEDVLATALTP